MTRFREFSRVVLSRTLGRWAMRSLRSGEANSLILRRTCGSPLFGTGIATLARLHFRKKGITTMKNKLMKLILSASLLMPVAALAQAPAYSPQNAVGLWIPRGLGLFPGQTAPVYLGTARFASDGTISGTPLDHNSSPLLGVWYPTGNL